MCARGFNNQHKIEEQHDLQAQSRFDSESIDADIYAVMNSQIADKSHRNYDDYNIWLIIFPFDNVIKFPDIIQPNLMGKLIIAHDKDTDKCTRSGAPSKNETTYVMKFDKHYKTLIQILFLPIQSS